MGTLTESEVENIAHWLKDFGYSVLFGPDIAFDGTIPERDPTGNYSDVVLTGRLREALAKINPNISEDVIDDAIRKITRTEGEGSVEELDRLFPDSFEDSDLGKIPMGWKVQALSEFVELIGGGTPKTGVSEYWGGDIPWFAVVDAPRESDVFVIDTEKRVTELGVRNSATKILRKGTTIISARGTVGKCALVGRPMAMNQSCYGIQGVDGRGDYFIYFTIRCQVADLQRSAHGSVFNTITRDTFKSIRIASPPPELTTAFDTTVQPLMDLILAGLKENATLAAIRDALLPKLISGEIRAKDAETVVEEVV